MAVKVLIKRQFKEGHLNEINKMLKKFRDGAMDQEGYMSSETLWDAKDPNRVVVASNWRSMEDWNKWKNSELRKANEGEFESFLAQPIAYEFYYMGIYPY